MVLTYLLNRVQVTNVNDDILHSLRSLSYDLRILTWFFGCWEKCEFCPRIHFVSNIVCWVYKKPLHLYQLKHLINKLWIIFERFSRLKIIWCWIVYYKCCLISSKKTFRHISNNCFSIKWNVLSFIKYIIYNLYLI